MYGSRSKWQISYITKVFKNIDSYSNFTNKVLSDMNLLNEKSNFLPERLYKFHSINANNIMDIKNRKMWLSDPNYFNDPYDCNIGYNSDEYEKKQLLKIIKANHLIGNTRNQFSEFEYWEIYYSDTISKQYSDKPYWAIKYRILDKKSEGFKKDIFNIISGIKSDLDKKIQIIHSQNIRVACFSYFKNSEDIYDKLEMWAHYADNHKGICVEYDISSLKAELSLNYKSYEYFQNEDICNKERLKATIKCGLFPVIYSSNRIKMPYTKLLQIKEDDSSNSMIDEKLYKSYITKSPKWSYEKEWRLLIDSKISKYFNHKIPFSFIKKIYVGCNIERYDLEMLFDLAKELDIEIIQMRMDSDRFSLDSHRIDDYYINKYKYLNQWPYEV